MPRVAGPCRRRERTCRQDIDPDRRPRTTLIAAIALAAALLLAACGRSDPARLDGVEGYFDAWSEAWSSGDPYAVARFYDESVAMFAQPDSVTRQLAGSPGAIASGQGRPWLVSWVGTQSWRTRQVEDVFLFDDGAAVVSVIDEYSTARLALLSMGGSLITLESTLRWRSARPTGRPEDERFAWVDELVDRYVSAWSTGAASRIAELYAEDARIDLHDAVGERSVEDAIASGSAVLTESAVRELPAGDQDGRAVFVLPWPESNYVAVVVDRDDDGCGRSSLIVLELVDGRIVHEDRGTSLASIRSCAPELLELHDWWEEVGVPPRIEEQVSGHVALSDGSAVDVVNGTPHMTDFFRWGVARFDEAGLASPRVESVTFAPVPVCERLAGLVVESDHGDPDLVMCTHDDEACEPSADDCATIGRQTRLALLHELAHVWLIDHVDVDTQERFMALVGTQVWRGSEGAPWHERGVEQAAETLAWGLLDEPTTLGRIGDPSCAVVAEGFAVLTGAEPLNRCG